ncbi:MBL fold metallo-hydrolase [Nocardia terpenica]|uniref:MBL fold metallo-hydrolase n=1 Tax=Nocardia terpenica TaxID=455432 RepID=UPI001892EF01|nr:MBL fold metallo-hydrolase [Nocardia terpenica]MBF6065177.1 MBL fold metallo-hydrolase [Nocardia terpenica]MBF6107904.1 MBL fold metallo-hydrolase [Nocardia terpenica]MBF6115565.1 MBL fold metallo-hydrolase [Nocardia terpenica]MBF6122002.1 MBL fold metallo-hydrolase [Nocardia terpenica]MBF6155454.1 MBL fold metallo-hydrolase [Nocardia terpenica]
MYCHLPVVTEFDERPTGFIAPNLSPEGLRLQPHEVGEGAWALMANQFPKDNNGLIVGEHAALVVDSGITPGIGRHIQDVAAELTGTPIRYLANTTFHGDHTFGNAAFPDAVTIFSSRLNKAAMTDLSAEKRIRTESMYGDNGLDTVHTWRRPDVVFDRFCEIDLGGRVVHLWHLGPGNGSGDTIVHVPDARVAWTGNFAMPAGVVPMMLIGDPLGYARTLRTMQAILPLDTLVPGHGFLGAAEPGISGLISYCEHLAAAVARAHEADVPVEELYDELPTWDIELPATEPFRALAAALHRLNILLTYRWLDGVRAALAR